LAKEETSSIRAADPPATGLRRTAVGSVAWQGLSYISGKILVLVSTVILARLLVPEDFGLVGLALVFITYAEILTDLGAAEALVFLEARDDYNDGALTISLLWSVALTIVAVVTAPAVAAFFRSPEVEPLLRVLSLSLLLGGIAEVPDALLRKNFQFRKRLMADLCRNVGQGAISIILAVAGLGAWAIVWGYVAGGLLWSVVAWSLVSYRPSPRPWKHLRDVARPLLNFGVPAVGSAFLLVLVFNIDYLIVGRRLGPAQLGFYTLAFRIPQTLIIYVFYALSSVAFPMFSVVRKDAGSLKRGYLTSVRLQSTYGAAVGVGIATVAPLLVPVLFGAKWKPAIVPLEAIALYAVFRAFGTGAGDVYKAIGRPRLSLYLALVRLGVLAPALWFVSQPFGIDGVAWTQVIVAFVMAALMQGVASRVIGVRLRDLLGAFRPALAVAIGVTLGASAIRLWAPLPTQLGNLVATVVCGAIVGIATLWVGDRAFVKEAVSLVRLRANRGIG
jgi:O-antigen/teichoic acid export membrane protein